MNNQRPNLIATKWSTFPDVNAVRPLGDADAQVLLEIREVLERNEATQRFGISLIHRHFEIEEDEVLFESTDVANRRQVMEVKKAAHVLDGGDVLETQWVFDGRGGTVVCVGYCHYSNGHKRHHSSK